MFKYTLSGGCLSITKEIYSERTNLRDVMQAYGADYGRKENQSGKVLATAVRSENNKIMYTLH